MNSLAEKLAEYACEKQCESAYGAVDGFVYELLDSIEDTALEDVRLTVEEEGELANALTNFVLNSIVPDAEKIMREWAKDAAEERAEIARAAKGEY